MSPVEQLRPTIGWREFIDLPELCSIPIEAKIDTGARTSALHAHSLDIVSLDGVEHASFELHPFVDSETSTPCVMVPIVEHRVVTSSNGARELRPVIRVAMELAGRRQSILLTLTNRDQMGFAMLVGRSALGRKFLIDPSQKHLTRSEPIHDHNHPVPLARNSVAGT